MTRFRGKLSWHLSMAPEALLYAWDSYVVNCCLELREKCFVFWLWKCFAVWEEGDQAILDGVDLLSLSLGGNAIAIFAALEKGIFGGYFLTDNTDIESFMQSGYEAHYCILND
ncbi:hypothetical protein Tco_1501331 [Tanacetum coccineum]